MSTQKINFKHFFSLFLVVNCFFFLEEARAQQVRRSARTEECFDFDWQFHLGNIPIKRAIKAGKYGGLTDIDVKNEQGAGNAIAYTDVGKADGFKKGDWIDVNIPHDWSIEGQFINDNSIGSAPAANGYLRGGIGFYRKEFSIPESDKGKKIAIQFDGIFRNSTIWINGHLIGGHLSGYTPSWYDLTDVLRYGNEGKNVILVKVDATDYEGWWYEGCGIYRHAWLVKTNKTHVDRFGTFVTTPIVSAEKATVNIKTRLKNENNLEEVIKITSKIVDKKGVVLNEVSSYEKIEPLAEKEVDQTSFLKYPLLWSPEHPELYKVLTEVYKGKDIIDSYNTTFGIRTVEITNKGFFLNGKLYPVRGTANHQDFAGIGVALPDKINEYRIKLLKQMGSNAYRCAHNPPSTEFLNACDSLGMLVLDENRLLSSTDDGLNDLSTLLFRDRNHPSVFMWSMENEEPLEGTATGSRILNTLVELTHKIDPTRQVTAAMNHGWNEGGYSNMLDVVGYNYGQRDLQYVKDHEQYPNRKMFVTESTSFVSTRGEYKDDKEKGFVSNLGNGVGWGMLPGRDWEEIVKYPYLGGMFAWTGFDYRGEPTPYEWPCVTSHFGIMDICGFPKDGYYAYKAAWGNEPIVHVFPHWNWPGKEGSPITIEGYSNCEEVELLLNEMSLGKRQVVPFHKLEWETVYQPGKLEARGYKSGKIVAKDIVETTSNPFQLSLNSDTETLKANGVDVAVVRVSIKDKAGRVVPIANNLVKFSIEGPGTIIGTGNGNPSSHEPDKASQRMAFNGYCMVLVQSQKQEGVIRLTVASDSLKEISIILRVKKVQN